MANMRVFYSCQSLGFAPDGTSNYLTAHGVQSVGITTSFNLENAFELGQLNLFQIIENIPDIELTCEKLLDGYPLLYHLATNGATSGTISGRANQKCSVALSVFPDTGNSASGAPIAQVTMSGMVVGSVAYSIPVEGNSTESVTLVGNNKVWIDVAGGGTATFSGAFLTNLDAPAYSGGVMRRQHVKFTPWTGQTSPTGVDVNGMSNAYVTVLPTDIGGVSSSGTMVQNADGTWPVVVQSINVSSDFGREPIYELGRKSWYFRYVTFPVEVHTDIEVLSTKWDNISATEAGGVNGAPAGSNLKNQTIRVQLENGTRLDMGSTNKLLSVSWGGGDAGTGGGNVTNRYSYLTYNNLTVYSPADPSGL